MDPMGRRVESRFHSIGWAPCCVALCRVALCCVIALFVGCQGGRPIAPVEGAVIVEGQPLASGRVMFLPKGGGRPALGQIESGGRFVLGTFRKNDGALVGLHRVTIISEPATGGEGKRLVFRPPADFTLEVKAKTKNQFEVRILKSDGWKAFEDS